MGRQSQPRLEDWEPIDFELYQELCAAEARESFWAYRQFMNPHMKKGWFQYVVANEFQGFYERMLAAEKPTLVLEAPPQHGKSDSVKDFHSWLAGKQADWKQIFTSYSDELGISANGHVQRSLADPKYALVFPKTQIRMGGSSSAYPGEAGTRNTSLVQFLGKRGSFYNTTVNGSITGKGLDFGSIDDPIKGRKEAQSKTIRDTAWNWLTDDFYSRFSEDAGFIMTQTRWHLDDPAGRFIEHFPGTRVLKFKAIATRQEKYRNKGEPLFPEHKSLEFLLLRKKLYTNASWESLYQQNPILQGGALFPIDRFAIDPHPPSYKNIARSVRYWDKAGTKGAGAYSCGVLMHLLRDGRAYIEDVQRGQWDFHEREERIKQTAEIDNAGGGRRVEIWVEQEPGSGGKESAQRTIMNLRGHIIKADRVTGDKETRAEPYAAAVQGGTVVMAAAKWNRGFLEEHEEFPNGKYKDQVDAAAGAFVKLTIRESSYDSTLSWVGT